MSDGADTISAVPRTTKPALPPVVSFALAAVLIVVGAFALWQAWLVLEVGRGAAHADAVRAATVAAIAAQVQADQKVIAQAVEDASVQQALQQDDGRVAAAAALGGCATTTQTAAKVQVAVAKACPIAKATVTALQGVPNLSAKLQADLAQAAPLITTACAGNATLDATTAQSLVQTGIPAMIADVQASGMAESTKQTVVGALTATSIVLQVALAQ